MKLKLIDLGKLTQEQKKGFWATSISGSQAWSLVYEPYNLLRDKLNVDRIHKSKYDIFNSTKLKAVSTNAMAAGSMYEKVVMEELEQHFPDDKLIYEDHTFQLKMYDDNDVELNSFVVTSTPDYYSLNKDGSYKLIGDVKCSTAAANEKEMINRYYYQALHNCYVLNRTKLFELDAKDNITKPLNRYNIEFDDNDFNDWENKLIEFFNNVSSNNVTAYDHLYIDNKAQVIEGKTIDVKPTVEYVADKLEANNLITLFDLKKQEKLIKEQIAEIEFAYKENYDNITIDFGDKNFFLKAVETKGTIDYASAIQDLSIKYNFSLDEIEQYRKESTLRKTISFKLKK